MKSNHQALLNNSAKLFHVSEEAGITHFEPRPSPSFLPGITGDVVFAISAELLHNYLLPRDCPRVTYYATDKTTGEDKAKFIGASSAKFIVIVESGWYDKIIQTTLYCYEFSPDDFVVIDENAGYHISYHMAIPITVHTVDDVIGALLQQDVELRFTPSLNAIANEVKSSSLSYSLIRMRNARP